MRAGPVVLFLVVSCGRSAVLAPDLPFALAVDRTPEPPASLAAIPWLSRAVPEKERAPSPGMCDYPGPFVPCWCGSGPLAGVAVNCESAEEYLESVQEFGPPRHVIVGFTPAPTRMELDIEAE